MKAASLVVTLLVAATLFAGTQGNTSPDEAKISQEVRHQVLMTPYYSIFDIIQYAVNDGTVTLKGWTLEPGVKRDVENAVKHIDGVHKVVNQIQEEQIDPSDQQIREAEYRSIYGFSALFKYAWGAVPPIHIIVNNGHVAIYGIVDNESDKQMIMMRAKQVPGTFGVDDHLQVAEQQKK